MKSKLTVFFVLVLAMIVNACVPPQVPATEPIQPTATREVSSTEPAEPPATPETSPAVSFQLAYLGRDGNVWFHPGPGSEPRQITADAFREEGNNAPGAAISYYFPQISSDGEWIAYRRDVAEPVETGLSYTFGLFLFNTKTNESRQVLEETPAGFDWKPGTHLLAYGLGIPERYFAGAEDPIDEALARGLMEVDAETGETRELVKPERGYALYLPQWSPDGRLLGFDELTYMEGRGKFAYYDFETGKYIAWDEQIGSYVFRPDGSQVIYDRLSYVADGTEDIFARPLQGGSEQRLVSAPAEQVYAHWPALSPAGDRVAYLAKIDGQDDQTYSLFVAALDGGEPQSLGAFETVVNLAWSPDGQTLIFGAGPWEVQQVIALNVADGTTTVLAAGTAPDVAR